MDLRLKFAFLVILFSDPAAFSQKLKKADRLMLADLQTEIRYLADDRLEGRRTGTAGEKLAADYIIAEFRKLNLEPHGPHGQWLQPFPVYDGRQIDSSTHFAVNDKDLALDRDYFPLAYSGSKSVKGSPAIALQESGEPWFVDLKEMLESAAGNPHVDLDDLVRAKVKDCVKKGASAVLFFNSSRTEDNIAFHAKDRSDPERVPVLYITAEGRKWYFHDESASQEVRINVSISEKTRTGNNVIGFLNNGASSTIILGAHYDHLGYGEDGNSLYRGPDRLIHNGADDNASGTAAVIELARLVKSAKLHNSNYLFIAFSGEELGLLGSKYFTDHPTIDLGHVNFMVNMDMVGRLNDSTRSLTIGGYGTSPSWRVIGDLPDARKAFNLRFDSSGTGPSDYTSFYLKQIPVLFFFTGLHSDYHKPTDDYNKINYPGELRVIKFIYEILEHFTGGTRLAFSRTREAQSASNTRFSVTLGIMPDYSFNGEGVRIDGISEGRPAQHAGLQAGDIIVKLGDFPVSSLENYMEALSKFKKGDSTHVQYKRGGNLSEAPVTF
jgi:aminopeptidase YwaD